MGMDLRIVAPEVLFPDRHWSRRPGGPTGESGGKVTVTSDIDRGMAGAEVVYTDVWASMGEEPRSGTNPDPHALPGRPLPDGKNRPEGSHLPSLPPCFHNASTDLSREYPNICEATDQVFESPASAVFDQAENRMHTIKAVMIATLTGAA